MSDPGKRSSRYLRRDELDFLQQLERDRAAARDAFKLLVPLDGSALAERILDVVRWIVERRPCEVMLVTVVTGRDPIRDPQRYLDSRGRSLQELGASIRWDVLDGDPAERIADFAEDYEPSLIAMATHGWTGIRRWVRGSVTEAVLRRAHVPVLAANPAALDASPTGRHFRSILVAVQGQETPPAVLPVVIELARTYGAAVTLFHAIEPPPLEIAEPGLALLTPTVSEATSWLAPHRDELLKQGIDARMRVATGPAASAIQVEARDCQADLIALTTHGRSGLERFLFGSVTEEVLRHCGCPILVGHAAEVAAAS
jgi:nucleotide-binding universal stress UspA family protein